MGLAPLLFACQLSAQGPPDTDIWLASLSRVGDSLAVGTPRNVTRRPGYDNQPSFTPDSKGILYTAVVDGQADIFRLDIASGAITRLTNTTESEYSPTVTPDGKWFSVVRVEKDSTQRLWKFPLAGGEPVLVLPNVKPVGYHAWIDDTTLVLYVLGRPATLQLANTKSGALSLVARDVGRAIQRVPGARAFTYVQRDSGYSPSLRRVDLPLVGAGAERPGRALAPVWATQEFHAWHPSGLLLWPAETRLMRWNSKSAPGDVASWMLVAALPSDVLRNITRLAVSADGRWLAFVAEPAAPPVSKER